ncbi:MAG: hypothetical protein Q7S14_00390 [bacterium]|nr:hypothetical protein [bacterium]
MYNWNTVTTNWDKKSDSYNIWKLEQLVNFGINKGKIDVAKLKKFWSKLDLDPARKKFMSLLLWPKQF